MWGLVLFLFVSVTTSDLLPEVSLPNEVVNDDGSSDYEKGEDARDYGNYRVMADWFRKAAAKGHGKAANIMGLLYLRGEIVEKKDPQLAVSFFELAGSKGEMSGYGNLGHMNERGMGVPVNLTAAAENFRRGGPQFNVHLARLLLAEDRTAEERTEGALLAEKAAEAGQSAGMHLLATLYQSGGAGYAVDLAKAVSLFKRASDMQHIPAVAKMAELYHLGVAEADITRNDLTARKLAERAAQHGEPSAMALLGFMCGVGLGGGQDLQSSVYWTRRAATANHTFAKANLEIMKREGFGTAAWGD